MFYHLEGTVSEISADTLVLDCGGIGFEITITPNTASSLKRGEKGKVYITEAIGENNFDLYGFQTWREKQFFKNADLGFRSRPQSCHVYFIL